ncbi:B12-binding domain-containing radical SAM protein [Anaerotalea alkaliphila]|uniref:B12-binding domain-containing radical SAM protein n=1 Tax=Anaerotalea alkaliphila TaxID=2662126 RepID=A0A7X5KPP7_9FIRM|nr:radical SAM protein [Anaerotalea alkaliphila]NDL68567.1 B12-binding domain-containing radical SAM protein [Anaerotalea alkaliphila]
MKVTFILPAIGKKPGEPYIGSWKMEPLTVGVLSALTPPDWERELFDDRVEQVDYQTKTDLVAIPVETYTAKRSYAIAARFRERGIPVVLGGYHPTLFPEEAALYGDCVLVGNAEGVWEELLADLGRGRLAPRYEGPRGGSFAAPDRSIYAGKKYLPISLVETGRGCGHRCEFCAIAGYYGCRYHPRDPEAVLGDLEKSPHKYHFLVDDNLVADVGHAKGLFDRMAPLGIKWAGQGTLSMARDKDLLKRMKRSGCELILVGFESLEAESLRQMGKSQAGADRDLLVERIHDAGIGIYATFVFGYDGDTGDTFARTLEFARRHKFHTAAFNHLLPFPGTPLYDRLEAEGRLLWDRWWLEEDYHYGQAAFLPKRMSPEELARRCRESRKAFASLPTVFDRGLAAMGRSSPPLWALFWAMNLRLGREVDEKMDVPLGRNLDAGPK